MSQTLCVILVETYEKIRNCLVVCFSWKIEQVMMFLQQSYYLDLEIDASIYMTKSDNLRID